jgi:hypothetical protein
VDGHSLKLHFCIFEDHKGNIIVWIVKKIGLNAQSLTQIKNVFAFSKHSNVKCGQLLLFFQISLFSTKCAPLFFLIGEDFNIDD